MKPNKVVIRYTRRHHRAYDSLGHHMRQRVESLSNDLKLYEAITEYATKLTAAKREELNQAKLNLEDPILVTPAPRIDAEFAKGRKRSRKKQP